MEDCVDSGGASKCLFVSARAEGDHLTVVLDGNKPVDTHSSKYARAVIGFQRGAPQRKVEFRNLRIGAYPPRESDN